MGMEVDLADLTLDNVNKGRLAEQFQEAVSELARLAGHPERFERDGNDNLVATVTAKVEFRIAPDGAVHIVAQCILKPPNPVSSGGSAYRRGGKLFVWANEPQQTPLFDATKKVARIGEREEDTE